MIGGKGALAAAATSSPALPPDTTGPRAIGERVTRPSSPEEGTCVKFDIFIGYREGPERPRPRKSMTFCALNFTSSTISPA